jgi:peptidoglycan/xylan/chitin deacetylase (PgdA/CDA1 family)
MARRVTRWLLAGILLTALSGLTLFLRPHWVVSLLAKQYPDVLFAIETDKPAVALTIDDGPDEETTPLILDALERHGARATFFIITDRIPGNEALLRRAVAAGHELGNHMTRDERSRRLSSTAFATELLRADEKLRRFDEVRWFRPGGGWFNDGMVEIARRAGYRTVLGSVYPFDAAVASAGFAAWHVKTQARPGSVIILHDGGARGRRTVAALELILPALERHGLAVTTLSGLADTAGHWGPGRRSRKHRLPSVP